METLAFHECIYDLCCFLFTDKKSCISGKFPCIICVWKIPLIVFTSLLVNTAAYVENDPKHIYLVVVNSASGLVVYT